MKRMQSLRPGRWDMRIVNDRGWIAKLPSALGHLPSAISHRWLSAQPDHQRGAAVEATGLFAAVVELGPLFAVAHRAQTIRSHTAARQVLADRGRAAFTKREVVLGRADVAGVAFDLDAQVRVLLERADRFVERARRFRPQAVTVEVEVHVLEDELLHRRPDHL